MLATTAPDGTSQCQTGSTNWTLRLCKTLYHHHRVTLVTPPPVNEPWILNSSITVLGHEVTDSGRRFVRFLKCLALGVYPSVWTLYSKLTSAYLQNIRAGEYDICWLLDDYAGIYLRDIPHHLPTIFVRHYLFSMQKDFTGGNLSTIGRMKAAFHKRTANSFDKWTTQRANMVTLGTKESARFLQNRFPLNRIEYLPTKPAHLPCPTNTKRLVQSPEPEERLVAIFLADMSFVRNAEGASWFLREVLPLILVDVRSQFHFQFIGRKPDPIPDIRKLPSGSSVEFAGFVPNLELALHSAQAAFIPIFGGNGIRVKTLTLLGTGLPTVSTLDALEGLDVRDEKEVLIANDANSFAKAFEKLLEASLRIHLHNQALEYMGKFLGEEEDAELLLRHSQTAIASSSK